MNVSKCSSCKTSVAKLWCMKLIFAMEKYVNISLTIVSVMFVQTSRSPPPPGVSGSRRGNSRRPDDVEEPDEYGSYCRF